MNQAVKKANKIFSKKICEFKQKYLLLHSVTKKADMSIIHLVLALMNAYYKNWGIWSHPHNQKVI